ncbi:MAG: hypothetical protein V1802_02395 [Candidatus Aenigmatarchaeota archaeon]
MRMEYIVISFILMLVVLVALVSFGKNIVPMFSQAMKGFIDMIG